MSIDTVKIINIQGADVNFSKYEQDDRFSFIERLVSRHQPTVLLLDDPYDGDSFKSTILRKYAMVKSDMNENIVMLYDENRVNVHKQRDHRNPGFDFKHLNPDNLVIPNIEVLSPKPMQAVITRFACVTWAEVNIHEENYWKRWLEEQISYSQHIAVTRNLPVLMGGDFRFPVTELKKLVDSRNKKAFSGVREDTRPMYEEAGIGLASQVDYQLGRPKRLLTMKVHEVQRYNCSIVRNDCFVASEELRLRDPSFINVDELWSTAIYLHGEKESNGGGSVSSQTTMNGHCDRPRPTQYFPTKTDIFVPPRTPRCHGG